MSQGQYVAAAYGVVFVFVLVYVAIVAAKLARLQRQTSELVALANTRAVRAEPERAPTREAVGEA